jgi:hypothetical protein
LVKRANRRGEKVVNSKTEIVYTTINVVTTLKDNWGGGGIIILSLWQAIFRKLMKWSRETGFLRIPIIKSQRLLMLKTFVICHIG